MRENLSKAIVTVIVIVVVSVAGLILVEGEKGVNIEEENAEEVENSIREEVREINRRRKVEEVKKEEVKKEEVKKEVEIISNKEEKKPKKVEKVEVVRKESNKEYYRDLPISRGEQDFIYNRCQEKGLDYWLVLGIIKTESNFNSGAISKTNDYGIMQINKINHEDLSRKTGTGNNPLDIKTSILWGTELLGELKGKQGVNGEAELLSSYNRGYGGFKSKGIARGYVNKVMENKNKIIEGK